MGTSSAFGGSRGTGWQRARSSARELPDSPSSSDIDALVADIATAIGWTSPGEDDASSGNGLPADGVPSGEQGAPMSWGPISARRAGRGAGAGMGRGGGTARREVSLRAGRRGRRSQQGAARAASRAARLAYGVAQRDARVLRELGLQFADLAGLTVAEQAQRIAENVVGATVEEAEREKALTRMLVDILESGGDLPPAEAARRFAEAYVYEIMLTEIGTVLRDAGHSDGWSANVERQIRDSIRAGVRSYPIDEDAGAGQIGPLIEGTLEGAREVLATRTRR
jgi:hypothetical protein